MKNLSPSPKGWSLIPFFIFIALYLGVRIYQESHGSSLSINAPIAMTISIAVALIFFKGNLSDKVDTLIRGLGRYEIIYIALTLFLMGAFSSLVKSIGGIETLTNMGLSFMPKGYLIMGIFVITSFIATASGTSLGSIAALTPIAIELADKSQSSLACALGAVFGGAMFGDGLSLISDTTIVSARTQGCQTIQTFKHNALYALPAGLVAALLFAFWGQSNASLNVDLSLDLSYDPIKALPYLALFALSIMGYNVVFVFFAGIMLSLIIGVAYGYFSLIDSSQLIWQGVSEMNEVTYFVLLTGGLSALIAKEGGFRWILNHVKKFVHSKKSAEVCIASLASVHDVVIANNGVSILATGDLIKEVAKEHGVSPQRSSSLLESYTCIAQSFLPYGNQMLLTLTFTANRISPFEIFPFLFYEMVLFSFLSLSIIGWDIAIWKSLLSKIFQKKVTE